MTDHAAAMDTGDILVNVFQAAGLVVLPATAWLLLRAATQPPPHPIYGRAGWNSFLKQWWARLVLWRRGWCGRGRGRLGVGLAARAAAHGSNRGPAGDLLTTPLEEQLERPRPLRGSQVDGVWVWGGAEDGALLAVHLQRRAPPAAPVAGLSLRLPDGSAYELPPVAGSAAAGEAGMEGWAAAGLHFEMLEPMRRWRLRFNGLLRRVDVVGRGAASREVSEKNDYDAADESTSAEAVVEPVSFSFTWSAASQPVELQDDWHPQLLARALAHEPWRDGSWADKAREWGGGWEQWGVLRGAVRRDVAGRQEETPLYLRGLRRRRWGVEPALWRHRALALWAWAPATGLRVALEAGASARGGLTTATWGHVQRPSGEQQPLRASDLSLQALTEHPSVLPTHFVARFQAGARSYAADVHPQLHLASRRREGQLLTVTAPCVCLLGFTPAHALLQISFRLADGERVAGPVVEAEEEEDVETAWGDALTLTLGQRACCSERLVGGKGASLARLTAMQLSQARVPAGFCVTAAAFRRHLASAPALSAAVAAVEHAAALASVAANAPAPDAAAALDDLRAACDRAERALEVAPLEEYLEAAVARALAGLLEAEGAEGVAVAVRSSALGEDSEALSAAGQNATLLGVRASDTPAVLQALRRCWASLFAFQSVEYRRQHGQAVACDMGVVVQVMVPAHTAGVLFTHHPVTGAAHQLLITANYGLGESVVAAQVEPDAVLLERDCGGALRLAEATCGAKRMRTRMVDEGGVADEELDASEADRLCLSPEECLRLGQIGVDLEAAFGGPRDIEWAIVDGDIYLLQARPITSLDTWTPEELLHELDSPVGDETEVSTVGNTGEVFPNPTTPLTQSFLMPCFDKAIATAASAPFTRYYNSIVTTSHHRVLINISSIMYRTLEEKINVAFKISEIAIFGHAVTTPQLYSYGLERHGVMGGKNKIINLITGIKESFRINRNLRKSQEIFKSIKMNECNYTSHDALYLAITQNIAKISQIALLHSRTTRVSVFSQIVALVILTEQSQELTNEHFSDISLLLSSSSDVISAMVPEDIKKLAERIVKSGRSEEFCTLPPALAVEWLEGNTGEIGSEYRSFLSKHGYRCIQEFDVMSETWEMNPQNVVSTIQTMVQDHGTNEGEKVTKTALTPEETVMRLKSVKSDRTRWVLSVLLPWCRRSVETREGTKAAFIAAVHQMRVAYRRLGVMLARAGRLPDPQLLFFLTHYELGRLLATRDPRLLAKAGMRRRLWPQWNEMKLPEIMVGVPKCIDESTRRGEAASASAGGGVRLQGTPVWGGTALGRACVVRSLAEISQLQRGDVLITRSTDVGWSPYFPLLAGVVTELGGLISHGAVVAREYGLPCIVGAEGATDIFKTGDTVLLVGTTGSLEKVDG